MPDDPISTLEGTLAAAWSQLSRAATDRGDPARFVVLATTGATGPEARTVVLRGVEPAGGTVEIFTDARTAKVEEIAADPRASLVSWSAATRLQIRLRASAQVLSGTQVADRWDALPPPARRDYAAIVAPGTEAAEDLRHPDPGPEHFAVVVLIVSEIDSVHLGEPRHRRALFRRSDGWTGRWLQP